MSDRVLDFATLQAAVSGEAAAFRCVTELQPAGGTGDKVFPPTYEGGKFAFEKRMIGGQQVDCVLLDSVASQANRIELALLEAHRQGELQLPVIEVDFSTPFPDIGRISTLEAPHRIADAILRDAVDGDGKRFRDTEAGRSFTDATAANATALFAWCPTALVLGMWDSTGPRGGLGAKFARCLVSEIVGIDVVPGVKTSSRLDPLAIQKQSGILYQADGGKRWTLSEQEADKEKSKPIKLGKDGKPSEANHGNVAPTLTLDTGGVSLARAIQTTTLSLPALRRLNFPDGARADDSRNQAARTALAALALCGAVLARSKGLDLRSRCLLVPTSAIRWELLGAPGAEPESFVLPRREAVALLDSAVTVAREAGLPWKAGNLTLVPIPDLVKLVSESRRLAAAGNAAEG